MSKKGKNSITDTERWQLLNKQRSTMANPLNKNIMTSHELLMSPNDPSRYWGINGTKVFRERHESSLYERVLAGLSTPKSSMKFVYKNLNGKKRKELLFHCRTGRQSINNAERITLSDNFVKNAVELAYSYPKYIMQLFPKAIPCFDNLFIEWNETVRYEALQKKFAEMNYRVDENKETVANDVGFYIEKFDRNYFVGQTDRSQSLSDKAYSFTFYTCDSSDKGNGKKGSMELQIASHSFTVDFDDDADMPLQEGFDNEDLINLFIGGAYNDIFKNDDSIHLLKQLHKHCGMHTSSFGKLFWEAGVNEKWSLAQYALNSAHGYDGDLRFIIAVFSLLNYPRYVKEFIRPKKINAPIIWGKKPPQFETKVIEIELPKSGVNVYHQLFTGHGTPKRQHVRRGHWRVTKDAHGRVKDRTWIQPCVVGNPDLGIINHEYVLRVKQDRDRRNNQ